MEMFNSIDEFEKQKDTRPNFLTVLCVLSFVSIGFGLLFSLLGLISGPMKKEQMIEQKIALIKAADQMRSNDMEGFAVMMEKIQGMLESINNNFYASSILSVLVMALGLFGVLKMWKGFKLGFHLYIVYSLLTIVQIYFFVSPEYIPTFVVGWNLAISGLFVFMYSRNLKWLS